MNYEEKYKQALENFKKIKSANSDNKELVNFIEYEYPELRESEDEKIRKEIISFMTDSLNWFPKKETKESWIAWLEKQGEKSAMWSEEDEYQINTILHGLDLKIELYKKEGNQVEENRYSTQYNWLKSLKDRVQPQPKQEWSEKDEKMLDSIIDCLDGLCFIDSDQINWLKSLKPNHWKPSEEQLNALKQCIGGYYSEEADKKLESLYDDLKKL